MPPTPSATDPYDKITTRLLEQLEAGTLPWIKPWTSTIGRPVNGATGRSYSGINILMLWASGWTAPRWFTYRQAQAAQGHVRRGEKGTPILFFRLVERADPKTGETKEIPFARTHTVFNEDQIEWPEGPPAPTATPAAQTYPAPAALIQNAGADIRTGGDRAFYSVSGDFVRLPPFEAFASEERYWATVLHELVHWTGAAHRLDRPFGAPGSVEYAFEELVAEIGAAFLCAALGVPAIDRHASAYIQHWMTVGRQDKRAFVRAARWAQAAADALLEGRAWPRSNPA